jgi:hypothetical protein
MNVHQMVKEPVIESQHTVTYRPSTMSFKEYDNKMRLFRPNMKYREDVLTKEKEGETVDANKALVYAAEQINELQATDRIARSVYVLGNGGPTDAYTNQDTVFEIHEALQARYKNTRQYLQISMRVWTFGSTACSATRNSW